MLAGHGGGARTPPPRRKSKASPCPSRSKALPPLSPLQRRWSRSYFPIDRVMVRSPASVG